MIFWSKHRATQRKTNGFDFKLVCMYKKCIRLFVFARIIFNNKSKIISKKIHWRGTDLKITWSCNNLVSKFDQNFESMYHLNKSFADLKVKSNKGLIIFGHNLEIPTMS